MFAIVKFTVFHNELPQEKSLTHVFQFEEDQELYGFDFMQELDDRYLEDNEHFLQISNIEFTHNHD